MTEKNLIDTMMEEYSCIFYPMCCKARELLYCPKKVGKSKCDDYRQYLPPTLHQHYSARAKETGKSVREIVVRDLAALHKKREIRAERKVFRDIEYERV